MHKKYLVPVILFFIMILSVAGAIIFKHWLFMFVASEMIIFHLIPPFVVILSMIAYKNKLYFWFHQYDFEKKLYKKLKVKHWKDRFPTYDAKLFTVTTDTKETLIKTMIQSENVHLLLFFLSFVPLKLGEYSGHWLTLFLLSFMSAVIHIPFVMIQRYNLPRISVINFRG